MQGPCKLCNNTTKLQHSHIVPKFIFEWLKNTSVTGKLRAGYSINKRVQDGLKRYLLCCDCERLLSKWETSFANNIFYPVANEQSPISYDDMFMKFSVSLSWRVLTFFLEEQQLNCFGSHWIKQASIALKAWQKVLLCENDSPGKYEQHCYPFSGEIITLDSRFPANIHRYLQRSVELDVLVSNNVSLVYTKLPNILFVGYISLNASSNWRETRICLKKGTIKSSFAFPSELWKIIEDKAKRSEELKDSISENQKNKIYTSYKENCGEIQNSGTIKSLKKDVELFGMDLCHWQVGNSGD